MSGNYKNKIPPADGFGTDKKKNLMSNVLRYTGYLWSELAEI